MRKVVIVGGGNAGLCAAIAAREAGAEVHLVERAPADSRGGNSAFTAGLMRTVYNGIEDIETLIDLTEYDRANAEFGSYTAEDFFDTLARVTEYRCDPDLAETLVRNSIDTLRWMREHGVRFAPSYGRQAFKHGDKFTFWGGAIVEVVGGGPGLVDSLFKEAEQMGVVVHYQTRALELLTDNTGGFGIRGMRCSSNGARLDLEADAVVLAAGGFQSNAEWRARYLGPNWDLAKVRGTRYNTGDGIAIALDAGASPAGNWTGCHAVAWDRNAPEFGDLAVGDGYQKHSYPFSIMVNADGRRFLDEGADFRNYTYARYGREILKQPKQVAWQVFDQQTAYLQRDEYRIREITKVIAPTIEKLAEAIDDLDAKAFVETVRRFNESVQRDVPFNPNVLDGRGTVGIDPPKSNWAMPLEQGPFEAYEVTCGITFTFGGVRTDTGARVIDGDGRVMPHLYACGEMLGGLFYMNYPGGSGLTAGSVFGRIAGAAAAGAK
ncbi:FAD-dependent tricarballylate dehydrogenase TcuA [Streptomyces sp. NPDC055722]